MTSQRDVVDLSRAVVVSPPGLSRVEQNAITMVIEEVEKRSLIRWSHVTAWPDTSDPVIVVGTAATLGGFAPSSTLDATDTSAPEGYRLRVGGADDRTVVSIVGNDARGVLFGVGHLLRTRHGGNHGCRGGPPICGAAG